LIGDVPLYEGDLHCPDTSHYCWSAPGGIGDEFGLASGSERKRERLSAGRFTTTR